MRRLVVHVVDAYDDSPVFRAIVKAYTPDGKIIAMDETDKNGIAILEIPSGRYTIEVRDQLHFDKSVEIEFPKQDSIKIRVVKRTWTRS